MQTVSTSVAVGGQDFPIAGSCDTRFTAVLDRFKDCFANGQTGACIAVTLDGKPVVDLWGGFADAGQKRPWQRDTITCMHSVGKAVCAATIYVLVDRGQLDPDAPVATYWPEFAQAGKENIPLRYVLDHRSGLAYTTEPLPRGAAYHAETVTAALARQAPLWEPGTAAGYHVLTQGYILGEVVKRVTGVSLGTFFRREIAVPLGLDYYFGLPESEFARTAEQISGEDSMLRKLIRSGEGVEARFWSLMAAEEDFNSTPFRTCEIPSDNGHGNARAVARLFSALVNGGTVDGVRIMGPDSIKRMITEQHNMREQYLGRHYHQGSGVVLNSPPVSYQGPNPRSFGHQGVGGGIGFGDPDAHVGFAYGTAKHVMGAAQRDAMVDATFESLKN